MEFKIINETAALFGDSILTTERQNQLSKKLDEMVGNLTGAVRVCNIFQEMASYCNTPEELSYCIVLHLNWHYKRGQTLC